jgi:hypothetical protein
VVKIYRQGRDNPFPKRSIPKTLEKKHAQKKQHGKRFLLCLTDYVTLQLVATIVSYNICMLLVLQQLFSSFQLTFALVLVSNAPTPERGPACRNVCERLALSLLWRICDDLCLPLLFFPSLSTSPTTPLSQSIQAAWGSAKEDFFGR